MLNSLYGIPPQELTKFLEGYFPAYRAKQLLQWIYSKHEFDIAKMTNLPQDLKDFLVSSFDLSMPNIDKTVVSTDGTVKYRLDLADKSKIEMVLMPEPKKTALCISSQVGCTRGCVFCATGTMKLKRNLLAHEIVQQVLLAAGLAEKPLTNLVFMGMGEPLDNLDNVLEALAIIQDEAAFAFSPRRTTISTCGIVPGIHKLADSGVKAKLAVSLNSARDQKRNELMPVNLKYPLDVLKKSLLYYQQKSRFRITLEYILIPDHNMDFQDIKALRKFSGDLSCKINFIPYNPIADLPYRAPTEVEIERFMQAAMVIPQAITLRRSKGADIAGACGQLVANTSKPKKET